MHLYQTALLTMGVSRTRVLIPYVWIQIQWRYLSQLLLSVFEY